MAPFTVAPFNVTSHRELFRGESEAMTHWVVFAPDGQRALSASYANTVRLWDLPK
jgi:hypothetical protein